VYFKHRASFETYTDFIMGFIATVWLVIVEWAIDWEKCWAFPTCRI